MNIFKKINNKVLGIKDIPYNIKYGIGNLIKWFPVIWQDRDWDHHYLYVILQHKLKRMEKLHINYGHAMSSEQTAAQINRCINLLDRLINDAYDESAFKKYYEKWGRPKFNWIKKDEEYSELNITHEKVKTEKDKKQELKEFRAACEHEKKMRKQDVDYLFKYIRKHVEGWWD